MDWAQGSERIIADAKTSAVSGQVRWAPVKSIWIGSFTVIGIVGGAALFTWDAFLVFVILSAVTLCAGHSVGMHRRLIHNSFSCPLWLEYVLVYSGVLVGMAAPFGLMHQHDLRDWAQRQSNCHDYLKHGRGFWRDGFWQLHCDLVLDHPPRFQPEARIAHDPVYLWMERTWMLHQVPVALVLFAAGGWSWVVWAYARASRFASRDTGLWAISRTMKGRCAGASKAPACKAATCRSPRSSPWERAGTIITMRFPARRVSGFPAISPIQVGG